MQRQHPLSSSTAGTQPLHVRRLGQHRPASQVLATWLATPHRPIQARSADSPLLEQDDTLIDDSLAREWPPQDPLAPPLPGANYAGWTPAQRGHFFQWLGDPAQKAPQAFSRLHLAHLEVALFEEEEARRAARLELERLMEQARWIPLEPLQRTWLLAFWIAQDREGLTAALTRRKVPPSMTGLALGWLALMGQELTWAQWTILISQWGLGDPGLDVDGIKLLLDSLARQVGVSLLAYGLDQVGEEAIRPIAWRCNHRDLRIVLAQPDLRGPLVSLLGDALRVAQTEEGPALSPMPDGVAEENGRNRDWQLVLEFGQSRSDLFSFALTAAQKEATFVQLLDENRRFVYRVSFRKRHLRSFWRLWDLVGGWSETKIYLNGEQLEKWKIYPYSPYMN